MLSVHRADCERATQPNSSGGGGTIFPGSRPHTSVLVIECFLTRSMLFLKCRGVGLGGGVRVDMIEELKFLGKLKKNWGVGGGGVGSRGRGSGWM